jgi:hypothetical protein
MVKAFGRFGGGRRLDRANPVGEREIRIGDVNGAPFEGGGRGGGAWPEPAAGGCLSSRKPTPSRCGQSAAHARAVPPARGRP